MRKLGKIILSLTTVTTLVGAGVAIPFIIAATKPQEDISTTSLFEIDEDGYVVKFTEDYRNEPDYNDGHIILPSIINKVTIVGIRAGAFKDQDDIQSFTFPETLTEIGDEAFSGCRSLNGNIYIPDRVNVVGHSVFSGIDHSDKTLINVPYEWGEGNASRTGGPSKQNTWKTGYSGSINVRFHNQSKLFNFNETTGAITSLVDNFQNLIEFKYANNKISIPDMIANRNVTSIASSVFSTTNETYTSEAKSAIEKITEISISNKMVTIGNGAFDGAKNLKSVKLNSSLLTIGANAFINTSLSGRLILPSSLLNIGNSAFKGLTEITGSIIIAGRTAIGNNAFEGCTGITEVNLSGATSIGEFSFNNCTSLLNIPTFGNIETIPQSAFRGCEKLKSINLNSSNITSIGNNAFNGCKSIEGTLFISDKITSIGNAAFSGLEKITLIEILPTSKLTSIGTNAFANCTNVTGEVFIPDAPPPVKGVFSKTGTSNIKINVPQTWHYNKSEWSFEYTGNKVVRLKDQTEIFVFDNGIIRGFKTGYKDSPEWRQLGTNIIIPESIGDIPVTSISNGAFKGTEITTIKFPNSLNSIGDEAFLNCDSLKGDLIIPNEVVKIGERAFQKINFGGELILGEKVSEIGNGAFEGTNFIDTLILPNSLKTIGDSTFKSSSFDDFGMQYNDSALESIGANAFNGVKFLGDFHFPNSLKTIGEAAFKGTNVQGLYFDIDNSLLQSIGNEAFANCTNINTDIVIPNRVNITGLNIFSGSGDINSFNDKEMPWNFSVPQSWNKSDYKWDGGIGIKVEEELPEPEEPEIFKRNNKEEESIYYRVNTRITDQIDLFVIDEETATIKGLVDDAEERDNWNNGAVIFPSLTANSKTIKKIERGTNGYGAISTMYYPLNLEEIGDSAFEGVTINNLYDLPYDVKTIGKNAFKDSNSSGGKLSLSDSVEVIKEGAFENSNLTDIDFESESPLKNLHTIGNKAFANIATLDPEIEIYIPDSINSIGNDVFNNSGNYDVTISSPLSIYVDESVTPSWRSGWKGVVAPREEIGIFKFNSKKEEITGLVKNYDTHKDWNNGNITIPNELSAVGKKYAIKGVADSAFKEIELNSVKISNGIESIGNNSFDGCQLNGGIELPSSIEKIGDEAFANNSFDGMLDLSEFFNSLDSEIGSRIFENSVNIKIITGIDVQFDIEDDTSWAFGMKRQNIINYSYLTSNGKKSIHQDAAAFEKELLSNESPGGMKIINTEILKSYAHVINFPEDVEFVLVEIIEDDNEFIVKIIASNAFDMNGDEVSNLDISLVVPRPSKK
ncbi:MAG: leucine-rich repeat protein [Mycoplasma sp.]